MNALRIKLSKIPYLNEKGRFLLFALLLILVLFVSYFLFRISYARYELKSRLVANIDKALYIFDTDEVRFNLDPDGIIPSDTPYTYRFSVANFSESKLSDVDLDYGIRIRTTTNLPITIQMYRNELPTDPGAINILGGSRSVQDEDGAWYRIYEVPDRYDMLYTTETTDYYTLVITFPLVYASDTTYVNTIENIEVTLDSMQIIQEGYYGVYSKT